MLFIAMSARRVGQVFDSEADQEYSLMVLDFYLLT